MPVVGMGTFGSDHIDAKTMGEAVLGALQVGYRHIDGAAVYANEKEVGEAVRAAIAGGVKREELFLTSKLWNDKHAVKDVIPACEQSLKNLGLDHVDCYLIHWPLPNFHPPGCDVHYIDPNARAYDNDRYLETWGELVKLQKQGKVRAIGTSSMTIAKFKQFLPKCGVRPAVNQLELHPHFQQPELFDYLVAEKIQPVGFCPLGSPNRPERDRTPGDTVDMEDPVVVGIAKRMGVHPATVCLKWALGRGAVTIPFSPVRHEYLSNIRAALPPHLADEDMAALSKIDKGCRLVKGQVFCWRKSQSWEDLWDENGTITQ